MSGGGVRPASAAARLRDSESGWVEYGHTMEDHLSGQLESGFVIEGYSECQLEDITELYFMTRAVKRGEIF